MEIKQGFWKVTGRFLGIVTLALLGVVGVVAIIGWRSGWVTQAEFAEGLQLGGMFAVGIGLLGVRGNWEATRGFGYQYSMTTTEQSSTQRTQRILGDFIQSYKFMLVLFISGGLSLLLGWLLESSV